MTAAAASLADAAVRRAACGARHVVVAGYGMAAARFGEEVRRRDPEGRRVTLTVVGDEPHGAYNRVLLSSLLAGELDAAALALQPGGWGRAARVRVRTGTAVVAVHRDEHRVELSDGSAVTYDDLVLATGSRAWLPPADGLVTPGGECAPGVAVFRTLDDCRQILELSRLGARVAVLGGGLLGLEAARGLAGRGTAVTVVHPAPHLMERQLDSGAARVLERRLRSLGIEVKLRVGARRWIAGTGLELDDGTTVACEAVVVAAGVRARTELAESAGLEVGAGVRVDDRLATTDPRIYAIGDCAEHPGPVQRLAQPAFEQAAVLAALLTGADPTARYRGTPAVTRLKARDIELTSVGDPNAADDETAETLCVDDPARGRYARLTLRADRVAGAIMLGLPDAAATIAQLYDCGAVAPADRLGLLLGRALPGASPMMPPAGLPASALICRCNTVTKGALATAWRDGARSPSALAMATRATTGCGGCRDAVCGIAEWLARGGGAPGDGATPGDDTSNDDASRDNPVREGAA